MGSDQPSGSGFGRSSDDPTTVIPVFSEPHTDPHAPAQERRSRGLLFGWLAVAVVVIAVVGFYLIDVAHTSGEIERNTQIAGIEVGGRTPDDARALLRQELQAEYTAAVTVDVHGTDVRLPPAEAGLAPDIDEAIAAAGTSSASPLARFTSFFQSTSVPVKVSVDKTALRKWVTAQAAKTDIDAVEGSVTLSGATVKSIAPVTGRSLDIDASVRDISAAWTRGGPGTVASQKLPVTERKVRATAKETTAAVATAKRILSGPVDVEAADVRAQLTPAQIAQHVTIKPAGTGFSVSVDVAALRAPLTARIEATQTTPQDAVISLIDGQPNITEAVTGRKVVWDSSERALRATLDASGTRVWKVVYTATDADLTTQEAKELGIKEEISTFTTNDFAYASGQNIKVLAEKMNGVIIQPGETFSLNDFTGPRGTEQGYIESGIIENGRPGKAIGGGLSQFTTTFYNATYFAGLQQIEHQAHSYWISRYPAGREATIFIPDIDFVFKNDHPTAVLVKTIWTESSITVTLFGTKQVEVESVASDRYDITPPPTTTIPYGESCNDSDGTSGFSIDDTRIIRDLAGKELKREKQTTVYNGQFQVICEPPPPAPTTPVSSEPVSSVPVAPSSGPAPGPGATVPTVPPSNN